MTRIGLFSDTHGFFDPILQEFYESCDELWHAGDIGNIETMNEIERFKPVRAVYGNIDGEDLRSFLPSELRFQCENLKVFMVHVGGYPGNYPKTVKRILEENPPNLFISGHSHICKVIYDKKNGFLHINPGAAGKYGFHEIRTAVRFVVEGKKIADLEILEIGKP